MPAQFCAKLQKIIKKTSNHKSEVDLLKAAVLMQHLFRYDTAAGVNLKEEDPFRITLRINRNLFSPRTFSIHHSAGTVVHFKQTDFLP